MKKNLFYYFVSSYGTIGKIANNENLFKDEDNNRRFKVGNFFRTEQEAKESKFYKVFHEED